jgi:hypothetical protein
VVRIFSVLAAAVLAVSCLSLPYEPEILSELSEVPDLWDTRPIGGELIFIGAAGERLDREEAIALALQDAARRLAFFHAVGGYISEQEYTGAGFLDYQRQTDASLSWDTSYESYLKALNYDLEADVFTERRSVFVRTRYTPEAQVRLDYARPLSNTKPWWVDEPPKEISGFQAGVGVAGPRLYYKDTIIASYENAAYALIKAVSNRLQSTHETAQDNVRGTYRSDIRSTAKASGALKGFYVLDTWTDPASLAVWTLAIIREGLENPEY